MHYDGRVVQMREDRWDVFICHAPEDHEHVARPLANLLSSLGIRVWIDESRSYSVTVYAQRSTPDSHSPDSASLF